MTLDRIALKELADKGSDADLLREMLAFITAQLMEMEVEGLTGAAHGARTGERTNQRNGYRDRKWETRAGTVDVRIVNAGAKLGQRPGVKVGHLRFEHDKARKPLREGAFVLLPLV
jgi:hypothetical protein